MKHKMTLCCLKNKVLAGSIAVVCLSLCACEEGPLVSPGDGHALNTRKGTIAKGKPGGGGGPKTPPAGTIYATIDGVTYAMNGDGDSRASLGSGLTGEPSRLTYVHNGDSVRWFIASRTVGPGCHRSDPSRNSCYPDSTSQRELVVTSSNGTEIVLLNDLLFDVRGPRWSPTPEDGRISFWGRRFPDAGSPANEGGIYTADVTFGANGVPSLGTEMLTIPTNRWGTEECLGNGVCQRYPAVGGKGHDWSPDGTQFVYSTCDHFGTRVDSTYIWDGVSHRLLAPIGSHPRWSAGDLILFTDYEFCGWSGGTKTLYTIEPSGANLTQIDRARSTTRANWKNKTIEDVHWSPSGGHMLYRYEECLHGIHCGTIRIVRRKSDGGGRTTLDTAWWDILGWR